MMSPKLNGNFQEDKRNQLCPMQLPSQVRGGLGNDSELGQVEVHEDLGG